MGTGSGRGGRISAAIDALKGELVRSPDELRAFALDVVADLGAGTSALWYELAMVRGNPYPVRHQMAARSTGKHEIPLLRQLEEEIPWPTVDPRLPPKQWDRRFTLLPSIADHAVIQASRLYDRVWRPANMNDQLRMVVYHRGEHVAWIGAIRSANAPRFTRADRRRLAPLAGAIADALVAARAIERAGEAERGGDLLVSPRGRVAYASDAGRAWLARPSAPGRLAAFIRAVDRGEPAPELVDGFRLAWSRLGGPRGAAYLVQIDRPSPVRVHASFRLSRAQCEVARLAAAGATASEIASMQDVAPETVRGQIKQVYELLDIGSRAELGRVFADIVPHVELPTVGALRRKRSA